MEILQLRYFCDAAITENFSATARRFGVPPSDISQSIKRLERDLDGSLFIRRANRISLTPQGKRFFEKVSAALSLLEEGKALCTSAASVERLRIAANAHRRIVMKTVVAFRDRYPDSDVIVKSGVDVQSEEFDVIIATDPPTTPYWQGQKILSEDIVLAIHRNHPLAKRETITARELEDQPFITMGERNSTHRITHRICGDYGFVPRIAIQSDDPFYVRKCVELGLGIAFVPALSWRGQFSDEVVFSRMGNYTRDTFVYVDGRRIGMPVLTRFVDMLVEECQREKSEWDECN